MIGDKAMGLFELTERVQDQLHGADNLCRAMTRCKRLINANAGRDRHPDKFVTLTFSENETDLARCNDLWHEFIERLEYTLKTRVRYVAVPQIQRERNEKYGVKVWHYHAYFFGLDYANAGLRRIWNYGSARISAIDEVDDIGAQVSRHMEKDFQIEELTGHRRFLSSSGLSQPVEPLVHSAQDLSFLIPACTIAASRAA
jgi:hypothetical protein